MNNRELFDYYKEHGLLKQSAEERVQRLVNGLLQALFIPCKGDQVDTTDNMRIDAFGIDDSEPINWGDLSCTEVKEFTDGSFLVTIEECAPGDCPTLCSYIETFMASYGWKVQVQTEW